MNRTINDCGFLWAEKLQISTATNLVKIKKVDPKVYYVLNKDTVRKAIEFLERELEL